MRHYSAHNVPPAVVNRTVSTFRNFDWYSMFESDSIDEKVLIINGLITPLFHVPSPYTNGVSLYCGLGTTLTY